MCVCARVRNNAQRFIGRCIASLRSYWYVFDRYEVHVSEHVFVNVHVKGFLNGEQRIRYFYESNDFATDSIIDRNGISS